MLRAADRFCPTSTTITRYHVASQWSQGLTIIHIFGFEDPKALKLAEKCGIAFQLTNIIRDVREDAEKDRIYLPAEDLERFGVSTVEMRGARRSEKLRKLLEFEARRARGYYAESAPLVGMIHPGSQASLRALIAIYSRLLERIRGVGLRGAGGAGSGAYLGRKFGFWFDRGLGRSPR